MTTESQHINSVTKELLENGFLHLTDQSEEQQKTLSCRQKKNIVKRLVKKWQEMNIRTAGTTVKTVVGTFVQMTNDKNHWL